MANSRITAPRVERVCCYCQIKFIVRESQIKRPNSGRYCSVSCKSKAGAWSLRHNNKPRGEKHRLYKAVKKEKKSDPVKNSARFAVRYHLKRGNIVKTPCEVCGETKVEAHHKDYTQKLDVQWLCRKHHRQADYRDGTKQGDFGH